MRDYRTHRTTYEKREGKWIGTETTFNEPDVYRELTSRLIAKKIEQCKWITSIRCINHYNGWKTIYVYYNNGFKDAFLVER